MKGWHLIEDDLAEWWMWPDVLAHPIEDYLAKHAAFADYLEERGDD